YKIITAFCLKINFRDGGYPSLKFHQPTCQVLVPEPQLASLVSVLEPQPVLVLLALAFQPFYSPQ
ncbi:MAG: hypothetical protein AB1348_06640, partial [Nitrospirota bacterium]